MKMEYYAGGEHITEEMHNVIMRGEANKMIVCPAGQPGTALCVCTEHLMTNEDGDIDPDDPIVKQIEELTKMPLSKLYVMHLELEPHDTLDPLSEGKRAFIYGYLPKSEVTDG